jgi:ABC-type multidrug transport system ATPase subunit
MIRLSLLTAHAAPYGVSNVSLELGAGIHALLGAPIDGVAVVVAVMAGWIRPRAGTVILLGDAPAKARRRIAYVPVEARLPPSLRVAEALDVAASVRGEPAEPAKRRLRSLGVEPLADRWTHSLALPEARAVLMAEAVTSRAAVLLFDEPRVEMDPRAVRALPAVLRERAAQGSAVVFSTSSPRDAADLSSSPWLFSLGRLIGRVPGTEAAAGGRLRMRVVANDTRKLLGALAAEPPFARIELDRDALILTGSHPKTMAEAVARAALAVGVELQAMRLDAPSLDELYRGSAGPVPEAPAAARPGPQVGAP